VIALIAFCAAANYPQAGFPRRIGGLLTINIIFEVQFFVGGLVVKVHVNGQLLNVGRKLVKHNLQRNYYIWKKKNATDY